MENKRIRIISVLLILALALAMSACGSDSGGNGDSTGGESALELYNAANKKLNESDSYSASTDTIMSMAVGEETIDADVSADIKQVNKDDKIELEMDMTTDTAGQKTDMKAYYTDGYYYIDTQGYKVKSKMDIDEIMKQTNSSSLDIEKDAVKDESVKDVDGGKEINMTVDGQKMTAQTSGMLGSMSQLTDSASDISMGDFNIKSIIDQDGNIKNTEVKFTFKMTVQGQETSADATVTMDVDKIGGVEVNMPEDLDSYLETAV